MNLTKKFYPVGNWSNEFFSAEKWLMCDISYDDEGLEVESNYKPFYLRFYGSEWQAIDNPNNLIPDYLLTVDGVTWRFKPDLTKFSIVDRTYSTSNLNVNFAYYKNFEHASISGIKYEAEDVNCPWMIVNSKSGYIVADIDSFNRPVGGQNRTLLPLTNNFSTTSSMTSYLYVIRKSDVNKVLLYNYGTLFDSNFNANIWPLLSDDFCKEFYSSPANNTTLGKSISTMSDATLAVDMQPQFKSYWKLDQKTGVFTWQDTINTPPAGYDATFAFGCEIWSVTNPLGKRVARFIYNKNKEYFVLFKYATGTNVSSYYSTYTFNPSYFYAINQESFVEDGVSKKRWCYYMWNKQDGFNYNYVATSYDGTVPQWYTTDLNSLTFTFKKFLPVHETWPYQNWTLVKESNYINPFNITSNGTLDADNVATSTSFSSGYVDGHIWADMKDVYFNMIRGEVVQ